MLKLPKRFWRLDSAESALGKVNWALFQTAEEGRKKTIISVDADEAIAMYFALEEYIAKHSAESEDSVNLWAYEPIACDDEFCCGDCDSCNHIPAHETVRH